MITHQIVNVIPKLIDGHLFSLAFTLLAFDGDLREETSFNTPTSLPDRVEPYTQSDFMDLAGQIAASNSLYTELNARIKSKQDALLPPGEVQPPVVDPVKQLAVWFNEVDDHIGKITDKYTRFTLAYTQRESAAIKFKAAGYTGDPTEWITRYADNVKMTYKNATDLVLHQATQLRQAVMDLDNLRMDKYLIINALTFELAQAEFNRIIRNADTIASTL